MNKFEFTLAYFIKDNQILLPLKKKKIGKGKHNGVGGRVEPNENHEEAMIRECIEEVGLTPIEYEYVTELRFNQPVDGQRSLSIVHIYICRSWTGELTETDEMKPYWFEINKIPYNKTMDDCKYWLPQVLSGQKIIANFDLDENYITLDYNIEVMHDKKRNY